MRAAWALLFLVFLHAMPSWGQAVIRGGKEWLQPASFIGQSWESVNAVCPSGVCNGRLSAIDITGYTWASEADVNNLMSAYGVPAPYVEVVSSSWSARPFADFQPTWGSAFDGYMYVFVSNTGLPGEAQGLYLRNSAATYAKDVYSAEQFPSDFADPSLGAMFFRDVQSLSGDVFAITLEEPIHGEVHGGIGNLRGWTFFEAGVEKVEIYIDGEYAFDAPYGGSRPDVAAAYPEFEEALDSGFSAAYGYSNLGPGQHTITARAITGQGDYRDATSTFEVVAFHKEFIGKQDVVDTSQASISASGDEILLEDVTVDGKQYDLVLKWRVAEQGFEIVEIQ